MGTDFVVSIESLVAVLLFTLGVLVTAYYFNTSRSKCSKVPLASPHLPVLGNALAYKKHPDRFLHNQTKLHGPIFRINLAGLETYILTNRSSIKQHAMAPESVLSSRAAVADFGFKYTLGDNNVFKGADFHRDVVKSNFSNARDVSSIAATLMSSYEESLRMELSATHLSIPNTAEVNGGHIVLDDFMMITRRIILRGVVDVFLSRHFSVVYEQQTGTAFATEFMDFQDTVEEATATAAVLPVFVAYPLCLYGCQQRRLVLTERMSRTVQRLWTDLDAGLLEGEGVWLRSLRSVSSREAADLIIGLLFAAHKNPAIAASQCVLFLLESAQEASRARSSHMDDAALEAQRLYNNKEYTSTPLPSDNADRPADILSRSLLETLRLTAHSIGAIRKVVSPQGWKVSVEGSCSSGDAHCGTQHTSQDYVVPCGSYVGASHIVPHRDETIWGEYPERFNPNRRNLETLCADSLVLTTFSAGVHKCPGQRIASLMIRLYMVLLLGKFHLSVSSPADIPAVSFERATLAQRDGKCRVLLKPIGL